MSNRSRTAGFNYERSTVREMKELGFEDAVTSRSESRAMDNAGVDIFGTSMPFHIQCKNSKSYIKYHDLLTEERLPVDKPTLIFHKKTRKANTRFITEGEYVIMKKIDFYNLFLAHDRQGNDIEEDRID